MALLTLILKIIAFSALKRPERSKSNRKKPDTDIGSGVSSDKIDNKNVNLSSNIKKMNFKIGFFIFKAKLVFTQLRKMFTKALILYHFNLQRYIQLKTEALGYTIGKALSQMTFGMGITSQVTFAISLFG